MDIFIAKFLRQEGFEKDKRDGLEELLDHIKNEENHIGQWSAEEHKQVLVNTPTNNTNQ